MKTIILDPGHGMSNKKAGVYDPGATSDGYQEATIALQWANELRGILSSRGYRVVRTRIDQRDPAPVYRRDDIAHDYKGDMMISLHCNAFNGKATGVETFYRGEDDEPFARSLTKAVADTLGLKIRGDGSKTEKESQHTSLAVMDFDKCWLIELGFIDNPLDRSRLLDSNLRSQACISIAIAIDSYFK